MGLWVQYGHHVGMLTGQSISMGELNRVLTTHYGCLQQSYLYDVVTPHLHRSTDSEI